MLKIGIIGIGSIAQKAYLPILYSRDLELHLYSRDQDKLSKIGRQYRITNLHKNMESFLDSGISGAFVHTATVSHEEIIGQLLLHHIHVYVDKPITYDYESSKRLTELAESKSLILMTGFNRRYAPAYRKLKELPDANMIIMQKNRASLPGDTRTFVFDDFIHVVDTLRYLFPYPIKDLLINGRKKDGLLWHVVIQFLSENGATAIGIMNRDSGTVEEKLEIFTSTQKWVVQDVIDTVIYSNKNQLKVGTNDWDSTLLKRGFEDIISDFLRAVETDKQPQVFMSDALLTHEICEKVVEELNKI